MTRPYDRREFLKSATGRACGGLMAAGPCVPRSALSGFREPRKQGPARESPSRSADRRYPRTPVGPVEIQPSVDDRGNEELGKSFVTKDYLAATQGLHVVKSVYMEVDVRSEPAGAGVPSTSSICAREADNPMVGAVISGRPASGRISRVHHELQRSQPVHQRRAASAARPVQPGRFCASTNNDS